jgi:hypothetical protein
MIILIALDLSDIDYYDTAYSANKCKTEYMFLYYYK